MSVPEVPEPAALVISVLAPAGAIFRSCVPRLEAEFGSLQEEIGPMPFDFTSYYEQEMGPGIKRWLWFFPEGVDRGELAGIKLLTNEVEQSYTKMGRRRFNLDPGLLSLENFILATGKNRAHRIYIGKGIFADLTLVFRKGTYHSLEWTYPDYASAEMIGVLNRLRESYKCRIRPIKRDLVP
ncbi:MAG: DUF4416 family protein [Pseudomonadota bacterium]